MQQNSSTQKNNNVTTLVGYDRIQKDKFIRVSNPNLKEAIESTSVSILWVDGKNTYSIPRTDSIKILKDLSIMAKRNKTDFGSIDSGNYTFKIFK